MRVAKHLAMSSLASYIANQLHVTTVIETNNMDQSNKLYILQTVLETSYTD